jgi:thiamine-phosphate diphosphorylase / hydroxyethylthiazole kinase
LREILKLVSSKNPRVKTVAIGGLNGDNVGRIRYQSEMVFPKAKLDGVAVVSALMSASDPRKAAADLKEAFNQIPVFIKDQGWTPERDLNILSIKDEVARIVKAVHNDTPLVHHLTNNVRPTGLPLSYQLGCQKLFRERNIGDWSVSDHV